MPPLPRGATMRKRPASRRPGVKRSSGAGAADGGFATVSWSTNDARSSRTSGQQREGVGPRWRLERLLAAAEEPRRQRPAELRPALLHAQPGALAQSHHGRVVLLQELPQPLLARLAHVPGAGV